MANRLANEKSPYLLQHADNPVDWYPWGQAAIAKARQEDKPIFLSIGYATCHWCHVMAHESFADPEVAEVLNRYFVSIKVDREERPDLDQVYMTVCQVMTGQGGWPLTALITPDGQPFFAGTYFPKRNRLRMPGLLDILEHFAKIWRTDRNRLLTAARDITRALNPETVAPGEKAVLGMETLKKAYTQHARSFDPNWGGFGQAPKFPSPHHLTFLLRWHRRQPNSGSLDMVEKTLKAMRRGGLFDQIGFGFHRYSVDERWLVPHFEKMLCDQALLTLAYTEAFQFTGREEYAKVVKEIAAYVLRDMTSPEGGFWSAEDADSEGEEGLFYLWTPDEVQTVLGQEMADLFCGFYNITPEGNFEQGKSIPHITADLAAYASRKGLSPESLAERLDEARQTLFQARERRVHPLKDDKVLTGWNGLMIAALARAGMVLNEPSYTAAAARAADFIARRLTIGDLTLLRRYRLGEAAVDGFLEDYAYLAWGLIELYEATFDLRRLEAALDLTRTMLDLFWDAEAGGLFLSGEGHEALILRGKEVYDGAMPSANAVAALNLFRLGRLTGRSGLEEQAERILEAFSGQVSQAPMAYTHMLGALDFALGPGQEIVLCGGPGGPGYEDMVRRIHQAFLPSRVLLGKGPADEEKRLAELAPFTADLPACETPTVYLCQNFSCQAPIQDLARLEEALEAAGGTAPAAS